MKSHLRLSGFLFLAVILSMVIVSNQCEGVNHSDDDEDDHTYHDFPTLDERDS